MATTAFTNSECLRISAQLRSVLDGDAWHGPSLLALLNEISPEQANARALSAAHSIWELTLHIEVWLRHALAAMQGRPIPPFVDDMPPEENWPLVKESSAAAWQAAKEKLLQTESKLASEIQEFGDERLREAVPGRNYDFERLLRGSVQHCVYHSGQIAILMKAIQTPA